MQFQAETVSLLELCIQKVIDNLRYVGAVDGVEMQLLQRILPHCNLDQLTRIESRTQMDLSPVTDVLWKRFYQQQFGEENMNLVVKKMKLSGGVHYKWKDLFKAKTEKQKEVEDKMVERLTKKYQAEKAEKQSKQIKICTKVPPSSKRSFFGGSGPSNLSNYKNPMLKKARMEVNSRAKMQSSIQRNNLARSSQPRRITSPNGQPMRTMTIHRPNSTITVTKPTIHRPNSTVAITKPAIHRPNSTIAITKPAIHRPNSTVAITKPAIHRPNSTVAITKPAIHRPNSTDTITKPTISNRPNQNSRPKF